MYTTFYNIFYNFHQMFCGTLANKIINKIIKSVFKPEIQIFIKNQPPPHPNKSKGKSTSAVYTIPHIQTKNSQCGIRSCPPNKKDDCLPCFLYKSFFYVTNPDPTFKKSRIMDLPSIIQGDAFALFFM